MESLRKECAAAFEEAILVRALHLLPSLDKPKLLRTGIRFGIYIELSCTASLLHLSSMNGWFDVVKDLITNYHFDPQETDDAGHTCLHYAADGIRNVNGSLDVMKYLINHHHCDPMATNSLREPVLHCAVKHIDIVKYLITECGCDPMTTGGCYNMTTLHYAAREGSTDVIKYLINDCNCDPMATDEYDKTVLHYAVKHIDIVKYLITECGCDPMTTGCYNMTTLHYAAEEGSTDIIKYLINDCNCDPMATNRDHETVLHYAVKYIDIVKYLITECGCDPMTTGGCYNMTTLHYAAREGSTDVIKYLINDCNCDPMATDEYDKTVLHYAVKHIDIVKYLITECGCDPMTTGWANMTTLHYAAQEGSTDVIKYLINDCNCDPMATNSRRESVLHYAVKYIDIVKYLITECDCDPMTTGYDNRTTLHYAAQRGSTDVIKYLINDCNCDPMSVNNDEETLLHHVVSGNNSDAVEYLLSTGKCDLLARNWRGDTPMKLAAKWHKNLVPIFKKFGKIKSSHPVDSYVNVLLLGNPGAGKSTLSHVITDTATGFVPFGTFRNVKGVEPCTAGIIPTKLQHKTLGNIILHDFAGHSEYYSSHSAVIENLLQGSGGVFLIVVNILEKEAVKQLHQWLTVVRNEAQKALDQCHIIIVASHVDEISDPVERRTREKEIQEIIGRERCDSVYLDCRKLGGSGMGSFFNKLSSACESICSTSGRNLSLYSHMMYGLLEERKENILTLSDIMSAAKDNDSYVLPDKTEEALDVLHSLDSIGMINVLKSEGKVWVIVNKGILLSEVNGILFAPETFKEHIDIASNTGIVSVSGLIRLFPDYDPDMLICFLQKMELCQEMNPSFLGNNKPPSVIRERR